MASLVATLIYLERLRDEIANTEGEDYCSWINDAELSWTDGGKAVLTSPSGSLTIVADESVG